MAEYILRPDTDDKQDWTEVPVGSAADRINDLVTQPTAPDTGTDYIESSTPDQSARSLVGTTVLAGGETVVYVEGWYYVDCPSRSIDIDVFIVGTNTIVRKTVPAGTTGWQSVGISAPLTQAQVNNLAIQATARTGTGSVRVYASYIRLVTRTDIWDAANAKFRTNWSPTTGLSVAAGFFGSDVGPSVDLGAGRSLFYGGDASMASAAGQQHWFGNNPAPAVAPPRAAFVRNIAVMLDSYDVEAAAFTYYTGGGNAPYHANDATYGGRWPFKAFIHAGRLFTVGRFPDHPALVWIAYTDNFAGPPNTWTWTYLPPIPGFCTDRGNGEFGIWDDGAGLVYMWSHGPRGGPNTISLCRVDVTAFHDADWRRPEWWTGSTWNRDRAGSMMIGARLPIPFLRKSRGNLYPVPPAVVSNQGAVHRRADNRFQLTVMDDWGGNAIDGAELRYALTAGTTPGSFGALASKFVVPEGERYVYGPAAHPQLTWVGKGANDQVWTYASNYGGQGTWAPLYYSRFVKALAVT